MYDEEEDIGSSLKLLVFLVAILLAVMLATLKDRIFHAFTLDIRS